MSKLEKQYKKANEIQYCICILQQGTAPPLSSQNEFHEFSPYFAVDKTPTSYQTLDLNANEINKIIAPLKNGTRSHLMQSLAQGRIIPVLTIPGIGLSNLHLRTSSDKDATAPPDNLFQCLTR